MYSNVDFLIFTKHITRNRIQRFMNIQVTTVAFDQRTSRDDSCPHRDKGTVCYLNHKIICPITWINN